MSLRSRASWALIAACLTLGTAGARAAQADSPGWVSSGSDGSNCITRDAYLANSYGTIIFAARLRCSLDTSASLVLKDSTTNQILYRSAPFSWQYLGGTYWAKLYQEIYYAPCTHGHLYQTVVNYTVTNRYSSYYTTGSPDLLC